MTALEDRIRQLAPPARPVTPVEQLRDRSIRRRRRRTAVIGVVAVAAVVALATGGLRLAAGDDGPVVAGPPPTDETPAAGQRSFGGVTGVTLTVSPASDLVDGQVVRVRISGLDQLPGAQLLMCRGDVGDSPSLSDCDTTAVTGLDPPSATADQQVAISSILRLPGRPDGYDCVTAPAGCLLAVGTIASARGVAVPVSFDPAAAPLSTDAVMDVAPASDLTDGATATVHASGLRPNRSYVLVQCTADRDDTEACWDAPWTTVTSDQTGTVTVATTVAATVWSATDGVVDCTVTPCVLELRDSSEPVARSTPLTFAAGVRANMPRLEISPSGPYVDGQVVTVHGTGFQPGAEVAGRIGQCPADKDTRLEERCQYSNLGTGAVVAGDGTFDTTFTLREALLFTGSCREGAGCVLGWVINQGPTVGVVPLLFSG